MRRDASAAALLVLLAGCAGAPDGTGGATPDAYLVDEAGDAAPRFDLVAANFTELSGSLVVRIQIQNYADGLPLVQAVLVTSGGTLYARLVADPTRPVAPQVRAEAGRFEGSQRVDAYETCWIRSHPTTATSAEPWWILIELLHNRTGLSSGGTVTSLAVETMDEAGGPKDEGSHAADWAVAGGPNPYADQAVTCPLNNERARATGP